MGLVFAAGTGLLPAQTSAQAEKALESARHKEVIDGDWKGAIEQYRKIASQFSKQPEIAARALYQLGQCQEKLGQAEARQSYERIVRDYGSASQYAAMARARLSAMGGTQAGQVHARLLWDKTPDLFGNATSDARFFCYPDWDSGDLGLRDLVTGQSRRVTNKGGYDKPRGAVEWCAIAPDGKRIAFTWCRWDKAAASEGACELRMIGADGKDERILLQGRDIKGVEPFRWSPDMKWIATAVRGQSGDGKLVLVSPEGAPARTLLTLAQREPDRITFSPDRITFSPDGKWLAFHSWAVGSPADRYPLCVLPADGSASAATEVAADARTMGWTPDGKALLFTREFNGVRSLYLLPVANGKAVGEPHAIPSASGIGARFLGMTPQGTLIYGSEKRTTEAVTLPLDPSGGATGAARITMPLTTFGLIGLGGGIRYSPDGTRVLYTPSTRTVLIRSLADGSEHTMMPQMARMGRIEWAADSNSLLISGAASNGQEGVYQVDLRSGAASLVFAAQSVRLMAASPDGSTLYHQKQGAPVVARDLKTGSERVLVDTGNVTLDLKVSRDGKKLAVVVNKILRIVDVATGQVQTLYQPADPDASGNPVFHGGDWSADGQRFLVFARVDNYHRTELWTFPVSGGEPTKQRVAGYYRGVWVSPDGKQLDTVQWEGLSQVWSLENFLPAAK